MNSFVGTQSALSTGTSVMSTTLTGNSGMSFGFLRLDSLVAHLCVNIVDGSFSAYKALKIGFNEYLERSRFLID